MIDSFLRLIEEYVWAKNNFDLFYDVVTKEGDLPYQFKLLLIMANANIDSIFTNYECQDLYKLIFFAKYFKNDLIKQTSFHKELENSEADESGNESDE